MNRNKSFILGLNILGGIQVGIIYILPIYLRELNVPLSIIGLISLCRIPYLCKFIFASIPRKYGDKTCMLFSNLTIAILIFILSMDIKNPPYLVLVIGFCIMIMATIYNIACDNYRLSINNYCQKHGIITSTVGYRIGLLISSTSSLYMAEWTNNWHKTFCFLSCSVSLISIIIIASPKSYHSSANTLSRKLLYNIIKDILLIRNWGLNLLLIATYKIGECFLVSMIMPFCIDIGFSKGVIATITKLFGITASILGSIIGGMIISKICRYNSFIIGGIAYIIASVAFILLIYSNSPYLLAFVVLLKGLASGITTVILLNFILYLSSKNRELPLSYTILSSVPNILSYIISGYSGYYVESYGWVRFFITTSAMMILPMVITVYLRITSRSFSS